MKVHGKTIVITGAGNGIGRELTRILLKRGARVAAVDLNESFLLGTQKLAGANIGKLSLYVVDITDRDAVMGLPERVLQEHGSVDGLINVAGIIQHFVRINDMDFSAIEHVMQVNFWGTVNMTKVFLPYLLRREEAHIVNVSSMGGFLPVPGQSLYGASKAAVKLFTEGLHAELLDTPVKVTLVYPGAIATNIKENSGLEPDERTSSLLTSPVDAAHSILNAMEKNRDHVMIGSDAKVMHFLYNLAPKLAGTLINKQMRSHLAE